MPVYEIEFEHGGKTMIMDVEGERQTEEARQSRGSTPTQQTTQSAP